MPILEGDFCTADKLLKRLIEDVSNYIYKKETFERNHGYRNIESDYSIAAEP